MRRLTPKRGERNAPISVLVERFVWIFATRTLSALRYWISPRARLLAKRFDDMYTLQRAGLNTTRGIFRLTCTPQLRQTKSLVGCKITQTPTVSSACL